MLRAFGTDCTERETEMDITMREHAEAKVATMAVSLSDEALRLAWVATEGKSVTQELAIVRGWIVDEFNRRLGDDLFDEWLMTVNENGDSPNPLAFFARKGN
jgi:hypothetical protein